MSGLGGRARGAAANMDARNRRAMIAAGVGLVILIGYLGLKVVGGGGGGAGGGTPQPTAPGVALPPPGGPITTPTTTPGGTPPVTFPVYLAKDPFQPLLVPGAPTTTTPGATTGTTLSGGAGATTTTTSPSVGTSGASASGGTSAGSTAPSRGEQVALLDVYAQGGQTKGSVRVNDTVYTVAPGQSFDTGYQVVDLSLASGCGDFTFQSKPFRLCKGQQITK